MRRSDHDAGLRIAGMPPQVSTQMSTLLSTLLLLCSGCVERSTPSPWTAPLTVETIASACTVADSQATPIRQLCRELTRGNPTAIDAYRLEPINRPFHLTAYAAPVLDARREPDVRFKVPIRGLPAGYLAGDPLPTRRELHGAPDRTPVIGWVENALDAYLAEVNGSVQLRFADHTIACLAWVRTNDHPYTSLGRLLVERGHVAADAIDLDAIRDMHAADPPLVESLMLENDRAVFFEEIDCDAWPRASTGAVLRPERSVAVDPQVIPLGSVLMLETTMADGTRFRRIVAAVDTGGAIIGDRIDLYLGAGHDALVRAGRQTQPARVELLVLRSGREESNRE